MGGGVGGAGGGGWGCGGGGVVWGLGGGLSLGEGGGGGVVLGWGDGVIDCNESPPDSRFNPCLQSRFIMRSNLCSPIGFLFIGRSHGVVFAFTRDLALREEWVL